MTSFAPSKCLHGRQDCEEALPLCREMDGFGVVHDSLRLLHTPAECGAEFLNTYRRVFSPLPNYVKAKTLSIFRSLTKELRLESEKT